MCNVCGNDEQTICRVPIARILDRSRTERNFTMYLCVTTVATMLFGLFTHDVNPNNRVARIRNTHLVPFLLEQCSLRQPIEAQAEADWNLIMSHCLEFLKVLFKFAVQHQALGPQAGTDTWVWNVQWERLADVLQWLSSQGCPMDIDNDMCCYWIRAYMRGQAAAPQPPQPTPLPPQPPPQPPLQPPQPPRQSQQLQLPPAHPPARPHPTAAPPEQQPTAFAPRDVGAPAPMNNILVLNTAPLGDLFSRGNHAQQAPPADSGRAQKALELQRRFLDTCLKMNEAGSSKERYYARLQKICRSMEKLV